MCDTVTNEPMPPDVAAQRARLRDVMSRWGVPYEASDIADADVPRELAWYGVNPVTLDEER